MEIKNKYKKNKNQEVNLREYFKNTKIPRNQQKKSRLGQRGTLTLSVMSVQ